MEPTPIADDFVPVERLSEEQPLYPLDLFLCEECGHVQLIDVVDPELLFRNYVYETSVSLGLVEHFRRYADVMHTRYNLEAGSLVAEIGSNDGSLLRCFQAKGLRVIGIDPARAIATRTTEAGIETLAEFFTAEVASRIRDKHGPAALVAANNVFAHADNLADIVDGVRRLLSKEGVFVFEVSYLLDIVQKNLFDTVYHEHLCYHSVKPLRSFLARHDLQLIDVERISNKGGSIRGVAQLQDGPWEISPSVGELIALEDRSGLGRPQIFDAMQQQIERLRDEIQQLCHQIQKKGETIVGFGASATAVTLLYAFGLAEFMSFIVDDNPRKHNTFSPGCHLPVFPTAALYEHRPEYVLILAWNYAEPIMAKNRAFLEQGGHFILPMPQVLVV